MSVIMPIVHNSTFPRAQPYNMGFPNLQYVKKPKFTKEAYIPIQEYTNGIFILWSLTHSFTILYDGGGTRKLAD